MKNIFQKKEDEEVKERCNQLKEILRKIDEIWNPVIRIDRIDFNNKKIQDKSMERILILFEYNLKDFSRIIKESYPFKNESFNFYDYTNISKWDEKTKQINGYDQKNLFNKLIFDVLPKCNQIMNKQSGLNSFHTDNYEYDLGRKLVYSNEKWLAVTFFAWAIRYSALYVLEGGSYFGTLKNYIQSFHNEDYIRKEMPFLENFSYGSYEKEIAKRVYLFQQTHTTDNV
jgi:hypothetical protein